VVGFLMNKIHIRGSGANIFGRYVTSFKRFNKSAMGSKKLFAIDGMSVDHNDGLPAAKRD